MAAERIRPFKSSTELDYSYLLLTKSNDHVVDRVKMEISPEAAVTNSSLIDFRKVDGTTTNFTGRVQNIKKDAMWELDVFGYGYELHTTPVQNVYQNQSPESIVQDIIDNHTANLTYVSGTASNVTLDKYIADGYAIDIIKDLMTALQWQIRIDESGNFYFEPRSEVDNGLTFTHGSNFNVTSWNEQKDKLLNHVRVKGGFESFAKEETVSGTGTVFNLSKKPSGVVRAVVSATEVESDQYTVDAENKTITFNSSQTDPTFFYAFDRPIVVEFQDDSSIAAHDVAFKEVQAPWLNTTPDARRYARELVDFYGQPLFICKGFEVGVNFTPSVNEIVKITDNIRGISNTLVISKIEIDAAKGITKYEFGPSELLLYDWQSEVQDRIKKIERQFSNNDDVVFARLVKANLDVTLSVTRTWKKNSPVDSFILGHQTLSRLCTDLNNEPDCSDNGNTGTWNGTGIDGSQYDTSGYRLSAGTFNGSDRYVTGDNPFGADVMVATISFFAKFDSYAADMGIFSSAFGDTNYPRMWYDQSEDKLKLDYELDTTVKTIEVGSFSSTYITGTYIHVAITFDPTTAVTIYIDDAQVGQNTDTGTDFDGSTNSINVGRDASQSIYMNGDLDEFLIYNNILTTAEITAIGNKYISNKHPNMKLWWSFDNPKLGDRSSSRVTIT